MELHQKRRREQSAEAAPRTEGQEFEPARKEGRWSRFFAAIGEAVDDMNTLDLDETQSPYRPASDTEGINPLTRFWESLAVALDEMAVASPDDEQAPGSLEEELRGMEFRDILVRRVEEARECDGCLVGDVRAFYRGLEEVEARPVNPIEPADHGKAKFESPLGPSVQGEKYWRGKHVEQDGWNGKVVASEQNQEKCDKGGAQQS
ncbi:hypothetical protein LTR86_005946 [Recurvomyces mirabilis]|nr:hypothetical protein LTR86_005946 [Recurvomyces mirabilis]